MLIYDKKAPTFSQKELTEKDPNAKIFEKKDTIKEALASAARKNGFNDFIEIPVKFASSGVEVLLSNGGGVESI